MKWIKELKNGRKIYDAYTHTHTHTDTELHYYNWLLVPRDTELHFTLSKLGTACKSWHICEDCININFRVLYCNSMN